MRVFQLFHHLDVIELDVQELIDRLQGSPDRDVILEFDGDFVVHERLEKTKGQLLGVSRWSLEKSHVFRLQPRAGCSVRVGYLKNSMITSLCALPMLRMFHGCQTVDCWKYDLLADDLMLHDPGVVLLLLSSARLQAF